MILRNDLSDRKQKARKRNSSFHFAACCIEGRLSSGETFGALA
jgi:hypothetical protein